MSRLKLKQYYFDPGLENFPKTDKKLLNNQLLDLYKKNNISEKSFRFLSEILLAAFIEDKFNEKYLNKISAFDDKIISSFLKLGGHYSGR